MLFTGLLRRNFRFGELLQGFFGKSDSIVFNAKRKIKFPVFYDRCGMDDDLHLCRVGTAMFENILYESMQSQNRNLHFFCLRIDLKISIKIILEADLLDVQIILHMFQLFREDDHAVGTFEKVAEILHQSRGKIHD